MDIGDINRRVIEQFRAGGEIEGMHRDRVVLLTTTGARTGQRRTTPIMLHHDGGRLQQVFASHGEYVRSETLAEDIRDAAPPPDAASEEQKIDGQDVTLAVERV